MRFRFQQFNENNEFGFSGTGLTIANLNIQHLLPKLDELKCHLSQTSSPKILGLCETFLHDNIKNNELQIKNYKFERKDRKVKKRGWYHYVHK